MIIYRPFPQVRQGQIQYLPSSMYWQACERLPEKYWYIEFSDINSLTDVVLNKIIPAPIIDLLKKRSIKLIMNNYYEGMHCVVEPIYQKLIIERGIPEEGIIFISESFTVEDVVKECARKFNRKPLKPVWISVCEFKMSMLLNQTESYNEDILPRKKYLSFNRRWRPHRPTLVGLLHSRKLLDDGYVSLVKEPDGSWDSKVDWVIELSKANNILFSELSSYREKMLSIPDLVLDMEDMSVTRQEMLWLAPNLKKYYNSTYFSVVTETYFHKGTSFDNLEYSGFFTEKIFRPIAYKHPFIVLSIPNYLKKLKEIGYKTFEPLIDESYDSEENDATRMLMIVNEVERLCRLPEQELKTLVELCKDICEHNYQVLKARYHSEKRKLDN